MATSGSYTLTVTRDDIIYAAFRKAGVLAEGEPPSADMLSNAADDLNMMIARWRAKGANLWKYREMVVFPVVGQQSFSIGPTGDRTAITYVKTELASAASSGATSITVDSATGISNGDNIGIVQDDGTIKWTTVSGAPAGAVITLAAALTDDAAVDNYVYAYTSRAQRPMRITDGRIKINDGNETPLTQISRKDYFAQSSKTSQGDTCEYYYDPQLSNGKLYIWSTFRSVNDLLLFTVQYPVEMFTSATDEPDFPSEWFQALVYNLAVIIADDYGVDDATTQKLQNKATQFLEEDIEFDVEPVSIQFVPYGEGY